MNGERPGLRKAGEKETWSIWMQILQISQFHYPMLSCYYLLFGTTYHFGTTWLIHASVRGKSHLSLWCASPLFASSIANLFCTPPLYTILIFGSRSYHCSKESSGSLHQSFKIWLHTTHPSKIPNVSMSLINSQVFQSIQVNLQSFNATHKWKYKNNPFALHRFTWSKNYSM